ncbi:hypothetical protein METBIDRAFT_45952 [Metschnikowia bicuspidata var. bicuspidata NRRL YB-4993]|uniref:DASH complex subunit DAD4 n=1 Tax=Metschnikowia bicuspidata var. bicuspidata NRRL YB-4993 TaxID=869754 RepID=A0A1A0H667_9ASCO|nr:hypothetical protein METBIDRAFT_45952 [Metschnikowia bicuspidata var. bicuspidata NRRL YB-4993]OBA19521.1 hypothetical protein METBIDRAFT_45952 [Metschnikowia bicuspidata var. bicuspidata NRRL YB-4993]
MNNPHEEVQLALITRIVNNMKSLNESVSDMNLTLNEINNKNKDVEALTRMWHNYAKSTEYHLETTGQTRDPL